LKKKGGKHKNNKRSTLTQKSMVFIINWLWGHEPVDATRHELIQLKTQLNSHSKRETAFKERQIFWKTVTNYFVLILCIILCSISVVSFLKEQVLMLISLLISASISIMIWNFALVLIDVYYKRNIVYTENNIENLLVKMENLLIKLKQDTKYEQITKLLDEYDEWIKQNKANIRYLDQISPISKRNDSELVPSENKHSNRQQIPQKQTNSNKDVESNEDETELVRKYRELKKREDYLNEWEFKLKEKEAKLQKLYRQDKNLLAKIKHELSNGAKLVILTKGSTHELNQSSKEPNYGKFAEKYKMDVSATKFTGFWFERLLDKLVGYSPVNCLALICEQCKVHNGLVSIEDGDQIQIFKCWSCHCTNMQLLSKEKKDRNDTSSKEKSAEKSHEQLGGKDNPEPVHKQLEDRHDEEEDADTKHNEENNLRKRSKNNKSQ
jgi:hypothetical protein